MYDGPMFMEARPNEIIFAAGKALPREAQEELKEALDQFEIRGYRALFMEAETPEQLAAALKGLTPEGKLFLAGNTALCKALKERGFAAAAWSHPGNREDRFPGASYVLEEPAWVDDDSLNKIYQRLTGNPWKILETERTLVREFVPEDLEDIYGLYDEEAGRYLEPPGPDTERERQILKDYIGRIYGLFGFGHWAVLSKESGHLIGRMGFSLPTAREKEILGADAMLGYLTAKEARGAGLTLEVTRALLDYGKNFLLFERVGAEADAGNTASVRLLEKLGFERVMEEKGKILFSRKA